MVIIDTKNNENEIDSLDSALGYFLRQVGGARVLGDVKGTHGAIAIALDTVKLGICYLMFKRDWLRKFNQLFGRNEGFGQTVGVKILTQAIEREKAARVVIVMPDKKIYWYPAKDWLEWARKNNTIRIPSTEIGEEASIPAKFLKRL